MDDDELYSIGQLAERSELPVRTIRFYSDEGIVPPTERSPAGYRRYDAQAVARLDLVRTLRDLGLSLPTIRTVLNNDVSLKQVAAIHAQALDVQIHTLRLRRAVLRAVAKLDTTPEEMTLMHQPAKMSDAERHRRIQNFIDEVIRSRHTGFQPPRAVTVLCRARLRTENMGKQNPPRAKPRLVGWQEAVEPSPRSPAIRYEPSVRTHSGHAIPAGDRRTGLRNGRWCRRRRSTPLVRARWRRIHQIPVLFGGARRLFDVLPARVELEIVRVIDTPEAGHIRYRVRH
ncbi:MerR family transcriptional regulator [Rhodococcus opacus]|uniref:MerR family transcriptional regulator n=1 Tax=Rhodococcus opacus TaxID=37919 RepID=UPI00042F56E3|nr:MerR family transcriptional regulator [Rhodococcus opacus]AHK31589.1 Nodulation protein nolA [Rhodococcus opacus PD630]UDG94142.1 MerR family transcriptional regulator [Rhodococcus opacus PD630]